MATKQWQKRPVNRTLILAAVASLSFSTATVSAEEGPPGTDIYIAGVVQNAMGFYQVNRPKRISRRKGYDNQPYFLPDGSGLLYTAIMQMKNGQWQADSFEYNFKSKEHTNLTNTPLSEYSPTLMAGGKTFSSIVVEKGGKQLLWQHPYKPAKLSEKQAQGKSGRLFDLDPIGYHVWGKNDDLALFVLGDKSTLRYKKNVNSKAQIVAMDIGRSLRYVAKRDSFTFTQQKGKESWWLSEYQPKDDKVTNLVELPKGADYYTWFNEQMALTAVGSMLYAWTYRPSEIKAGKPGKWVKWKDFSHFCDTKITRLAVNSNYTRLAFVCDED